MDDLRRFGRRDIITSGLQLGVGGIALANGLWALPSRARAADGPYQVNIVNTSGNAGLTFQQLITDQGYLKEFNVAAKFENVADGSKAMGALISHDSDISTSAGFSQVIPAIEKGGKVKLVAGALLKPVDTIYTKHPQIQSVKDLVGKTIGTGSPGSLLYIEVVALLQKFNIGVDQVKFANLGSTTNVFKAVVAGVVDAGISAVDYYDSQEKYGVHSLKDANLWTELPDFTFQAAFASEEAIATKRDTLVHTLAAFAKLYRFAQSADLKDAFLKARAKALSKDDPVEGNQQWSFYRDNKSYSVDLVLSEERVKYMQDLNVSLGLQKTVLPFEQVADMSLARDALKLLG